VHGSGTQGRSSEHLSFLDVMLLYGCDGLEYYPRRPRGAKTTRIYPCSCGNTQRHRPAIRVVGLRAGAISPPRQSRLRLEELLARVHYAPSTPGAQGDQTLICQASAALIPIPRLHRGDRGVSLTYAKGIRPPSISSDARHISAGSWPRAFAPTCRVWNKRTHPCDQCTPRGLH